MYSRLQEEFAQGAGPGVQVSIPGREGRAGALPSLLDFMPPSEKSLLELGTDVVSKSLFCQSQISTNNCLLSFHTRKGISHFLKRSDNKAAILSPEKQLDCTRGSFSRRGDVLSGLWKRCFRQVGGMLMWGCRLSLQLSWLLDLVVKRHRLGPHFSICSGPHIATQA